jgi:hypothetical protein
VEAVERLRAHDDELAMCQLYQRCLYQSEASPPTLVPGRVLAPSRMQPATNNDRSIAHSGRMRLAVDRS